jgi:hypothetical protein
VHGTKIGVAISPDGLGWSYAGTAKLPSQCTDVTSWAPEVFYEGGIYHMGLTVVPGIFHRWGVRGAQAHIAHLTSKDLKTWTCGKPLNLKAARIIDATVVRLGSTRTWW